MNKKNQLNIKLYLKENNLLCTVIDQKEVELQVKQCFPWSLPQNYLSLRDEEDNEVYLIEDLEKTNTQTKKILKSYLDVMSFTLKIESILDIREEIEFRQFHVQTSSGTRIFQTKLEDWPEKLENESIIIKDLSGDIFQIESFQKLDEKSKKILQTYLC